MTPSRISQINSSLATTHIDNRCFSDSGRGWIDLLHERLEIRLAKVTGPSDRALVHGKRKMDSRAGADATCSKRIRTRPKTAFIRPSATARSHQPAAA
jgi:hypothetical protein